MKRSFALAASLLLGLLGAACSKPSADDCRKALANMQHLLGTENLSKTADYEGEVRRCKGGSSKEAVQCAIKAQSLDELKKCDFYKTDKSSESSDKKPDDQKPDDKPADKPAGSGSAP